MNSIMRLLKKLSSRSWIFNSFRVTAEGLALYRVFTALFILSFLLPNMEMYEFLGGLPDDFYTPPPGPMWLFDGFPTATVFNLLHAVLIISLISLLVGFRTSYASILTGVILLIIKGFFYSVGKINHDLLVAVVPIFMAFSSWGAAYSVDSYYQISDKKVYSWPLTLLALTIGFMMFTAGFPKLLGGWLSIDSQATLGHFFKQFYINSRQDLLAETLINYDNRFFWELLDYGTVLFEIGFLVAVFRPLTTRIFISIAVIFHSSIMMILNISFLPNFVAYAAFLNWPLITNKLKDWIPARFGPLLGICGGFGLLWMAIVLGRQLNFPELNSDLTIPEVYILMIALIVVLAYLGKLTASKLFQTFTSRGLDTGVVENS